MTSYNRKANVEKSNDEILKDMIPTIRFHAGDLIGSIPKSSGIEFDDLFNSGVVGLMTCIGRFNPEDHDNTFKTYAGFRIRGSMVDYLRTMDWQPRSIRDDNKLISKAMSNAQKIKGIEINEDDIAKELGISVDEYRKKLSLVKNSEVIYFEDLKSFKDESDVSSFLNSIPDNESVSPERTMEINEMTRDLSNALSSLNVKRRIIMSLYYFEELSMKEIGLILDVTESRLSQIMKEIRLILRTYLKGLGY